MNGTYNGVTSYLVSGAGSWGETADSCGDPGSYFYSDGGNGGALLPCSKPPHVPDLAVIRVLIG